MADHSYRVERHMVGDRHYVPGDTRVLNPTEAAHLVASGALTDLGPVKDEKAEKAAPKNKAEGDSPSNKAADQKDDAK